MKVITEKCVGCGKCVNECPNRVFELENGKAKAVNISACTGCLGCVHRCKAQAITSICGKLDGFQPYTFQEYYISNKTGKIAINELIQDYNKKKDL